MKRKMSRSWKPKEPTSQDQSCANAVCAVGNCVFRRSFILRFLAGGDASYFIAFTQTWAGFLLRTIHVIIIFIFTSLAKVKLREICCMKHGVTEITQTQFAQSNQGRLMRAKSGVVVALPMRSIVASSNQT